MRIRPLLLMTALIFLYGSCGNKKDAFDSSSWYFKIKVNNQWKYLTDDLGAFLRIKQDGPNNYPMVAFSGSNDQTKEYLLFNFDITVIRYNTDSSVMNTPLTKYYFHHFEYTANNKKVIETRSLGSDLGIIHLQEFKVMDTTRKFAGYFKGNMSYVNDEGKTVTITEGQFNLPRNDQKVYN